MKKEKVLDKEETRQQFKDGQVSETMERREKRIKGQHLNR